MTLPQPVASKRAQGDEMTGRARLLAAANRRPVDVTPVWFMRQAGRCLPEYRALRQKHDFMTLATTPELAVQATVMPVERLGVDGAVLFADIMLPLSGMGVSFRIQPGVGPVIDHPARSSAAIARLRVAPVEEATPYVLEAVRLLRLELGERAALLGFAGAPFTLACYLIEGRPAREYPLTKAMMLGQPELWHTLMDVLTEVTIRYLRGQIEAGADVVQLFDSWLGLLSPAQYERYVLSYTRRIFAALAGLAPTIHFSTGTGHLLPLIASTNPALISVDWRVPLDVAWQQIGDRGIQGNLDPTVLLAPPDVVVEETRDVLRRAGGRLGHIFNLGHGILPQTDPDQLQRVVETVRSGAR